jgi:hypothetical protein
MAEEFSKDQYMFILALAAASLLAPVQRPAPGNPLTGLKAFQPRTIATTTPQKPPVIVGFTAAPTKVIAGQSTTLSWMVTGSTGLSINQGVGAVNGTAFAVRPSATAVYTLTATNSAGSSSASVTVTVGAIPVIGGFSVSPPSGAPGTNRALSWSATGATALSIDHAVGAVTGTSTAKVTPSATTTYTLTATNAFGSSTATAVATVGNLPAIASFTATPAKLAPGQSATLGWSATGATSLRIDPGVGAVTGSSVKVTPTATTVYTLTATNAFGSR